MLNGINNRKSDMEDIIETLRLYFKGQPVIKAWLFGSFARGEQKKGSDIDILVTFDDGVGLFKYASMQSDLEHILDKEVDLVSEASLFPWVKESVINDRILIYERETA